MSDVIDHGDTYEAAMERRLRDREAQRAADRQYERRAQHFDEEMQIALLAGDTPRAKSMRYLRDMLSNARLFNDDPELDIRRLAARRDVEAG